MDVVRNNDGTVKVNSKRHVWVDDDNQPVELKPPCAILTNNGAYLAVEEVDLDELEILVHEMRRTFQRG